MYQLFHLQYTKVDIVFLTISHLIYFYHLQVDWTVIGVSDKDPLTKFFKQKLSNSSCISNLFFVGKKTANEIVDILSISDLYVHPSRIENSPNSICEAQILGLPVIAFDTGGISTLISHGKTGILVPVGDTLMLAHEIYNIIKNESLLNSLSSNSKILASIRNSPNLIKEKVYLMYNYIINDV